LSELVMFEFLSDLISTAITYPCILVSTSQLDDFTSKMTCVIDARAADLRSWTWAKGSGMRTSVFWLPFPTAAGQGWLCSSVSGARAAVVAVGRVSLGRREGFGSSSECSSSASLPGGVGVLPPKSTTVLGGPTIALPPGRSTLSLGTSPAASTAAFAASFARRHARAMRLSVFHDSMKYSVPLPATALRHSRL
jgi:hypothetical protein